MFLFKQNTVESNLKRVVLGKGDDLHDLADPGEDLMDHVEGDGVHHVLNNHTQDRIGTTSLEKGKHKYSRH